MSVKEFIPSWLYIKRHKITGMLYFGKTIRNPKVYKGSGTYWRNHLKKHGCDIETIWYKLFKNKNDLIDFAELFSDVFDIVNASVDGKKTWANLVPENGILGGQNAGMPSPLAGIPKEQPCYWKGKKRPFHAATMSGRQQSEEHIRNRIASLKKYKKTEEHCANISKAKKGKPNPKLSLALKGRPGLNKGKRLKVYPCVHCGLETTGGNLKRWHNDNCKLKEKHHE